MFVFVDDAETADVAAVTPFASVTVQMNVAVCVSLGGTADARKEVVAADAVEIVQASAPPSVRVHA